MVSKALVAAMYRKKLRELARLGVDVVAVVPREWREGGSVQHYEPGEDAGYELIVSPMRWNGHFHVHTYPDLPGIVCRVRPDLVHLDEEPFNVATWLGARAAVRAGAQPIFFSWQNLRRRYPPPFSMVERAVYRLCESAIAGNEEVAEVLRSKGYRGKLSVVPQFGVDTDLFAPAPKPPGPFTVGFLNRLTPAKAPLLMLEAMERLPDCVHLEIVGDGPLHAEVARDVERRGLSARVRLRSRVPSSEMPQLMSTLEVVVLPSLTTPRWKEQFGRVLIEAMASGVPVVGSDSGEIPRVIGDAGIVVPEGDGPALASAIARVHEDASLRADLSLRGRARAVDLFANRKIAERTLHAYEAALGQSREG